MAKKRTLKHRATESRYDALRKKYPEVNGKTVDFISDRVEDGTLHFTVRFTDKTMLSVRYACEVLPVGAELCDATAAEQSGETVMPGKFVAHHALARGPNCEIRLLCPRTQM